MHDEQTMIDHLVRSRLAGQVQTSVRNTKLKSGRLLAGDPSCTFGLSDWSDASMADIAEAVRVTAGAGLDVADEELGYIDPRATIAGMDRYARALAPYLENGGSNILLATGHPTGLLEHYIEMGRELEKRGNTLVATHDDGEMITPPNEIEAARTMRFVGSVGCVFDGLSLVHTHLSAYMETMLREFDSVGEAVDLVIGDHGMAGAAIERGIPTLSIADINDPALPLAYMNGRHEGVLVVDDNLAPRVFRPVTQYILEKAGSPAGSRFKDLQR